MRHESSFRRDAETSTRDECAPRITTARFLPLEKWLARDPASAHLPRLPLMPDAFALFNLSRRPWLDAADLREEFHRRSAALHPDAGGDAEGFAHLNAAHRTLTEPAARLRHLLELEAPEILAQSQRIPPALADRFMQAGSARQSAENFLAKHRAASSPLARALLAGEHAAQTQALDTALADLDAAHTGALARLHEIDAGWRERIPDLARLQAELSYLGKWTAQLRESHLALALAGNQKSEIRNQKSP